LAGEAGPVVQFVINVPTEQDIAEPEPVLHHGEELLQRDILAPADAVDVEADQLDLGHSPLFELVPQPVHRHASTPPSLSRLLPSLFTSQRDCAFPARLEPQMNVDRGEISLRWAIDKPTGIAYSPAR